MKRLLIFLLLSISVIFSSCDPYYVIIDHEGSWYVKNTTDKNIYFNSDCSKFANKSVNIKPGDDLLIFYRCYHLFGEPPSCDSLWLHDSRLHYPNKTHTARIYDENGVLLKEWILDNSKQKDKFFDESYWQLKEEHYEGKKDIIQVLRTWTFDITSEDIANE